MASSSKNLWILFWEKLIKLEEQMELGYTWNRLLIIHLFLICTSMALMVSTPSQGGASAKSNAPWQVSQSSLKATRKLFFMMGRPLFAIIQAILFITAWWVLSITRLMEKLNFMIMPMDFTDIMKLVRLKRRVKSTFQERFFKARIRNLTCMAITPASWTLMGSDTTICDKLTMFTTLTLMYRSMSPSKVILQKD